MAKKSKTTEANLVRMTKAEKRIIEQVAKANDLSVNRLFVTAAMTYQGAKA